MRIKPGGIALLAVLLAGMTACTRPSTPPPAAPPAATAAPLPADTNRKGPNIETGGGSPDSANESGCDSDALARNVSHQVYFEFTYASQKEMKEYLVHKLEVYRRLGDTPAARTEIQKLDQKHDKRMARVMADAGISSVKELVPTEECQKRVLRERSDYSTSHLEMRQELIHYIEAISELNDQLSAYPR